MKNSEVQSSFPSAYKRDYYGGALMVLIGLGAVVQGLDYHVGTLTHMGAGFFPVTLGVILSCIGVLIAGSAKRPQLRSIAPESVPHEGGRPEWRGWICILASIVAFIVLGKWGGLLPATFAITFISAMGDRGNTWLSALVLACVISITCVVIFWWALQVQFPLFIWG
jgi:Tripartite tricarboxylate transporter TctB family